MNNDPYFTDPNFFTLFQTSSWSSAWLDTWSDFIEKDPNNRYIPDLSAVEVDSKIKGFLNVSSLYPIGSNNPRVDSIYSEFWNFTNTQNESFATWLERALSKTKQQMILPAVVQDSFIHQQANIQAQTSNLLLIKKNEAIAYSINTQEGTFSDYTKTLSSNTRLKLLNRRKRLRENGEVRLVNQTCSNESFLETLNTFHIKRWGKPCFDGRNLEFMLNLLPRLEEEGHQVIKSALMLNEKIVSVLLDIQVGQRIYNLQTGYAEDLVKGVPLGTIHLGYQIESAFEKPDVIAYDLMAGSGKNTNYKEKIANQKTTLCDLVFVKPFWLKWLYTLQQKKASANQTQ